jgi:signal transduction histidine kinase
MPEGGTIRIETEEVYLDDAYTREHPRVRTGVYARARISDTGIGMEPEVLKKIFEPYFTTRREKGGTGLGLASVYWIVSNSGGHIDVTSTPGVGTIFSVYFPVAERLRQGASSDGEGSASRKREASA